MLQADMGRRSSAPPPSPETAPAPAQPDRAGFARPSFLQRADEFDRLEGLRKTPEEQHDPNDAWAQTSDEADALFGARMGAITSGEDPEQVRLPGGPTGNVEEQNIRKPEGAGEAKGDASADPVPSSSAEPVSPAQPDWMGPMQAFMAQQDQRQQAFMQSLVERMAPKAEPVPVKPDRSVRAMLRAQAREVAGDFASDEEIDRLAEKLGEAVWAERMQGHEGWKDNPEAEKYVAHARSSFEQERNKYSAMGGLQRELASLKAELAELKEAPARQRAREETLNDWEQAFSAPKAVDGVIPDDMIARKFPHVAQMARDHELGRGLAEYALGRYESGGNTYNDGQASKEEAQGVWGEVYDLNTRLEPIVKTLKGVSPDRRDVVVKALVQSSASDPGFAAIISRVAKALSVTAADPKPPPNAYADTTKTPAQQRAAPQPAKEEAWRNVPSMSPRGVDATPAPVLTPEQSWNESVQETDARMAEFFEQRKREILRTQAN